MKNLSKILVINLLVAMMSIGCGGGSNSSQDNKSNLDNQSNPQNNNNHAIENPEAGKTGASTSVTGDRYRLLAWNDLGMHCMDGDDFSVFSILPPYNNLVAQLVEKKNGDAKRVTSGVTLTYESVTSFDGKLNSISSPKTNFWDYAKKLFGVELAKDIGLKGSAVQSTIPQPLRYVSANDWWIAEGIPTSPRNNDGTMNHYPMVKVTAKDNKGTILATTTTVLPVSDEMDCSKCHASNSSSDEAKPSTGWVNNSDAQKDYKLNILKLHDDKNDISSYIATLKEKGYDYKDTLSQTVASGTPILCASCHKSNALEGSGIANLPPLTEALHKKHANVIDPLTHQKLDNAQNRNACYTCHPGSTTQCLRGAMGKAKNSDGTLKMQCQSCHGGMSAVGKHGREGWLDEPDCQSCHHDGQRETMAVTSFMDGTLKSSLDKRFATNKDTPLAGKSLYRFSTGHKGMQCSACHGATHAIYPSLRKEDNVQSIGVQGHAGTINDCKACHLTIPSTVKGGPHGMHTAGKRWVSNHQSIAEHQGVNDCKACHGQDLRGSALSKMFSDKTLDGKNFKKGDKVSCYDCHGKKW